MCTGDYSCECRQVKQASETGMDTALFPNTKRETMSVYLGPLVHEFLHVVNLLLQGLRRQQQCVGTLGRQIYRTKNTLRRTVGTTGER